MQPHIDSRRCRASAGGGRAARRLVFWALSLCLSANALLTRGADGPGGQDPPASPRAPQKAREGQRPTPAALRPVQDTPGLPRVLLIGDSISIGYTLEVRRLLQGEANVHRPPVNCGPTTRGLSSLEQWLGEPDARWDVIHFNWGLHDLKYLGPNGENLADPAAGDSRRQTPPEQYEENLRQLVQRLQRTGATLIWRTTTPVPEGAAGRVPGDAKKYNKIAARVMREQQIAVDDMYSYSLERLGKIQRPADVHFTPEGSRFLASRVAEAIRGALRSRQGKP